MITTGSTADAAATAQSGREVHGPTDRKLQDALSQEPHEFRGLSRPCAAAVSSPTLWPCSDSLRKLGSPHNLQALADYLRDISKPSAITPTENEPIASRGAR